MCSHPYNCTSKATISWEHSRAANSRETGNEATQTIVDSATTTGQLVRWLLGILEGWNRGVSVTAVENALILAASRRIFRPPDDVPLQPIRSLYYLLPVIDEVLQLRISQDYFRHLQFHIDQARPVPAAQILLLRKILLRHPFQRRSDKFPIRFEEAHRKSRLQHVDPLRTILEHSRVVHRIVVRDGF